MAESHPISGVAWEIHQELGEPSTPTTGTVYSWLEYNAGKLNNKISTFYSFNSGDYSPQLGHDEKDILKALYYEYYYTNESRKALLGISSSNILSLKDDQSSVSFINNKDVARAWRDNAKDASQQLKYLVIDYKHNRSGPRDPEVPHTGHYV